MARTSRNTPAAPSDPAAVLATARKAGAASGRASALLGAIECAIEDIGEDAYRAATHPSSTAAAHKALDGLIALCRDEIGHRPVADAAIAEWEAIAEGDRADLQAAYDRAYAAAKDATQDEIYGA
jgi:hypothetical protein